MSPSLSMTSSAAARRSLRACLRRQNAFDLGPGQPAAAHDAGNLRRLGTIHHGDPVHPLAVVAGFNQQRHYQYGIGPAGRSRRKLKLAFLADQRMQDGFQALARRGVGKGHGAHCRAVERAVGTCHPTAEFGANERHGSAIGFGQGMGNDIGVDHRDAASGEQVGGGALAAAYAAGETDDIGHGGQSPMVASA